MKTKSVSFRLPPDVISELDGRAKEQLRTRAAQIELYVRAGLKKDRDQAVIDALDSPRPAC